MSKKASEGKVGKQRAMVRDPFLLYSAAVQSVECDIEFLLRVYRKANGQRFHLLREDFCGTAALACEWVRENPLNKAWGVDLDRPTLNWAREHYVPRLGKDVERLTLLCKDVMEVRKPAVDVVAALNFSYWVFKERETLRRYFHEVRRSLRPGGIFFLDAMGGTEAIREETDRRRIEPSTAFDGTKVPAFTYVWEQARFNPVDHHFVCHIHFKLGRGVVLNRAFSYDWRLWTLPELQEVLLEAGFASADIYLEGWDEKADDTDGIFRRRRYFENQEGWVAYVVAQT